MARHDLSPVWASTSTLSLLAASIAAALRLAMASIGHASARAGADAQFKMEYGLALLIVIIAGVVGTWAYSRAYPQKNSKKKDAAGERGVGGGGAEIAARGLRSRRARRLEGSDGEEEDDGGVDEQAKHAEEKDMVMRVEEQTRKRKQEEVRRFEEERKRKREEERLVKEAEAERRQQQEERRFEEERKRKREEEERLVAESEAERKRQEEEQRRAEELKRRAEEEQKRVWSKIVIIDHGSDRTMAGFSGHREPRLDFPTVVGRRQISRRYLIGDITVSEGLVGYKALEGYKRVLKHPIENGVICCWNDMEIIWKHIFLNLRTEPTEHPVLLTEAPLNPKANREEMCRIFFQHLGVPAYYVAMRPVLHLYSTGRATGIVVSSGDGASHAVPVYEGHALPHAILRLELAGRGLTDYMCELLVKCMLVSGQYTGIALTASDKKKARRIKEDLCFVAQDFEAEMNKAATSTEHKRTCKFQSKKITISSERFRCPEALFNPAVLGLDAEGIHVTTYNSIMKCDPDLHKELYSNVVLSGGTTALPGFPERMHKELAALAPPTMQVNIMPNSREHSAFTGAAHFAKPRPGLEQEWISLREFWEESFEAVLRMKCF